MAIAVSQACVTVLFSIWLSCAIELSAASPSKSSTAALTMRATGRGRREALARRLTTCICMLALARSACDGLVAASTRL